MPGPKPKRVRADSTRLKSDIAANDMAYRRLRSGAVQASDAGNGISAGTLDGAAQQAFARATAQQDTLNQMRKAAPSGTHKSFAQNVDAFDGRALTAEGSPKPPSASIPRGNPTPDTLPRAVGNPSGVQRVESVAGNRDNYQTFAAGSTRSTASSGRGPSAPQSFNDASV